MKKFLLILLPLCLALTACAHKKDKSPIDSTASLSLRDDGFALVTGQVAANRNECSTGDPCYITMNLPTRVVHVIYHYDSGACESGDAVKDAAAILPGERVHAEGLYTRDKDIGVVDVCAARGGELIKVKK